jgi:hypothetical protein
LRTWDASGAVDGAIGGATSAALAGYLVGQAGGAANLTDAQRAVIVAAAMLAGGAAAGVAGQNVIGAATAAENEALNNSTGVHPNEHSDKPGQQDEGTAQTKPILTAGNAAQDDVAGDVPTVGVAPLVAGAAGAGAADSGTSASSGPKVPQNLQPFTNPEQAPVIPSGWVSQPGRVAGSTIYYPPGTDPSAQGSTYIRVMPPGSSPIPGLENGYWTSIVNGQPINPANGSPNATKGDTHVPLAPNSMPPAR